MGERTTMTDVLKIALDRRAELVDEISKLDEFIRMAEELIRASKRRAASATDDDAQATMQQRPVRVQEPVVRSQARRGPSEDDAEGPSRPQVIRRASAVGSN